MTPADSHARPLYRVRGAGKNSYSISIPPELGAKLKGKTFAFHLTENGLAYDYVEHADKEEGLPAWLTNLAP